MGNDRAPKKRVFEDSKLGKTLKRPLKKSWLFRPNLGANYKLAGLVSIVAVVAAFIWRPSATSLPPTLRPFPGPKLTHLSQFSGDHARRFFWGTYRPGLYFGMRTRSPKSPLFGVMWVDPTNQNALDNVRHEAQQGDGLDKYGWVAHDGESFGRQEILDGRFNITTSWVKESTNVVDWGARLEARRRADMVVPTRDAKHPEETEDDEQPSPVISFLIYLAHEDGSPVALDPRAARELALGHSGSIGGAPPPLEIFRGSSSSSSSFPTKQRDASQSPSLGKWAVHVAGGAPAVSVKSMSIRTAHFHNLTAAVQQALLHSLWDQHRAGKETYSLDLPDISEPNANVAVLQITARLPLTLDIAFLNSPHGDNEDSGGGGLANDEGSRASRLTGSALTEKLSEAEAAFETRFRDTFGALDGAHLPKGTAPAARAALSNLLGGMGYWYGHSLVQLLPKQAGNQKRQQQQQQKSIDKQKTRNPVVRLWDAPLFSATPSRSFFPRGFLWDEGFHQLLVRAWNPALSRDVFAHWLDLMTAGGWIAREQILGDEARARVPSEFLMQFPNAANPPTLFLVLEEMAQRATKSAAQKTNLDHVEAADIDFLRAAWPRLRTWFEWYNSTQVGPVPGAYRWRGRDPHAVLELNPKTLTSGLDDYPRASHPSPDERHLDLRCWLAVAARAMATVGAAAGAPQEDLDAFASTAARLSNFDELVGLHWDAASGRFADWGRHTEDVQLMVMMPARTSLAPEEGEQQQPQRMVVGSNPRAQFVPHFGYVSLFPLLMGLIPADAPQLGQYLQLLRDESELWTPHGLRSLSMRSSLYQARNTPHDPPYWRGAIWVNMNYLALRSLRRYSSAGGPHAMAAAEAADALQSALLDTLVGQYRERGYLWEQYDDGTGEGKGSHPFTGWTALLTLVAAGESSNATVAS